MNEMKIQTANIAEAKIFFNKGMNVYHLICPECEQTFYLTTYKIFTSTFFLQCPFCKEQRHYFIEDNNNYEIKKWQLN